MLSKSKARYLISGGWVKGLQAFSNHYSGSITMAPGVRVGKHSVLDRYMGGSIHIGTGSLICKNCKLVTCGGDINIGQGVQIGDSAVITAQGGVTIGNHVLFADNVCMIANEHIYQDINRPIKDQGCYTKPIVIGDGSWIGINPTILQGTVIGKNCVVGAGSVVKGIFS